MSLAPASWRAAPAAHGSTASTGTVLPRWPVTATFGAYAVWWALGLLDIAIIPLAAVMVLYLVRTPGCRVPRGFGLWLFFLAWAGCSIIMVDSFASMIGFSYRYLIYLSATVLFVYVYNARAQITGRYLLGLLTSVWLVTVVGGYLGVFFPSGVLRTPMSFVVQALKVLVPPASTLLNNELITHMVVRRFAQFDPNSFFQLSPRPSAPFRFTNNWGNVYSVLLPLVIAYAWQTTRRRRWLIIGLALPLSAVPALLTLNRGMLIGVAVATAYASVRLVLMGRPQAFVWSVIAAAVGTALFTVLPVQERIEARLANEGSSNETRSSLYQQSLASVPDSPVFGFGVPKEGTDPNAPPVGTQGQVWMILVSHGPVALFAALGWLGIAILQSLRRRDPTGLAAHVALVVGSMELLYYGALPYGLPLLMSAAALAVRGADAGDR